jgi:formylglycine-generating enzyme required for sulfatase activity
VAALITDGAVNRLVSPEPEERDHILATYERRARGEKAKRPREERRWAEKQVRRWFLSYHSGDQALAERLKAALEQRYSDIRVFFAPASLRAGGFWSRTLAEEIAQAEAFILLVGEKGVGDWQVLEYDEALDKRVKAPDFAIILVVLEGQTAPGLPFLRSLHWIVTPDPSSEKDVDRLFDAAVGIGARPGELWRYTSPYRGLAAMEEKDSDYFFGREQETVEVIKSLEAAGQLVILLGNSGVGKSSLAQAGVLAALKRQAWPERADAAPEWPDAFRESRRWCFLTLKPGTEPVRALVEQFLWIWQFDTVDPRRAELLSSWVDKLIDDKVTLPDLLDATEARYSDDLGQSKPPAFLLYIDQGEELYVRAQELQRRRFSEVIAQGVADPRLYMLMSMRSDFLGELQKDEPLYKVYRQINVPPLREPELREVVSRPAELLSARFETVGLADIIARRAAEDSVKDVGALPLLSYTLDDMWTRMVNRADGVLRLPAQALESAGVLGNRADAFLAAHPNVEDQLRRIFALKLATVREGEEPTRRRALRSEFTDEEWRLVNELADHPYRLLVTATPKGGETYAEVAHDAIFRRWAKLRDWIAAERQFLAWKTRLEAVCRAWRDTPDSTKSDALLMGASLTEAQRWRATRGEDLSIVDRAFIDQSTRRESEARARARHLQALVYVLLVGIIAGLVGWINQSGLKEQWNWYMTVRPYMLAQVGPYVLSPDAERALKPGDSFKECAKDCPEMIVIPAGAFTMGLPAYENDQGNESPQHKVTIAKPLAVSKFGVTFAQWDLCVSLGGCPQVGDSGFGRGTRPVINLSWNDAQRYVAWLSQITGKRYLLLSEAEWEYAARAGTQTAFFWGAEIGIDNANCIGCGSRWDNRETSPVGSFPPNAFGLFDMAGNVWQWVQDCYHRNYDAAPADGAAWDSGGNCERRVVRGGSWNSEPNYLRSASRGGDFISSRNSNTGFRVRRML